MSVEIWPPIAPDQLKIEEDATLARELTWLLNDLRSTLRDLKSALEETYALLAPIDPGSTLVVSTPRHETVKGHVTRVGTRLVKGSIHLKLKTIPPQTLALDPAHPIHIPELTTLNTLLTQSVDILQFIVSEAAKTSAASDLDPKFLSSQLRLLSEYMSESLSLIKGPSLPEQGGAPDTAWTSSSVPPTCFSPPLPQNISVYLTLQDASLVLFLRTLEPADIPVSFGSKLALAIGTARRLEHDEADRVFGYCPEGADESPMTTSGSTLSIRPPSNPQDLHKTLQRTRSGAHGGGMGKGRGTETSVYVREKVRVESADPSLLSLSSKLSALGHTLSLARRNLGVVMGEDVEDKDE
ncbi:RAVE subunit 2/Rogdi [Xylariales sp. AK1849]|nr:RAVE subunit 2/Rogdi [Xylariales sp. AK1849]